MAERSLESISITPPLTSVPTDVELPLTALGTYSDGTVEDVTDLVEWSSSNPDCVSIVEVKAKAVAAGEALIRASLGTLTAKARVTVKAAAIAELEIVGGTVLEVGSIKKLKVLAKLTDGTVCDVTDLVSFSSSVSTILSVKAGGIIKAHAAGKAKITAELKGLTAAVEVNVLGLAIQKIEVVPGDITLEVGASKQLIVLATLADGTKVDITAQVNLGCSDTNIAEISLSGVLTAKAKGEVIVKVELGELTTSVLVKVKASAAVGLEIKAASSSVAVGTKLQLRAFAKMPDGSSIDVTKGVVWGVVDTTVGAVENLLDCEGLFSGIDVGTTKVIAKLGDLSTTLELKVTSATLVKLELSAPTLKVPVGIKVKLKAVGVFSDGTKQDLSLQVGWSTDLPDVGCISNEDLLKGLLTAKLAGFVKVKATLDGISADVIVEVTDAQLTSLSISAGALLKVSVGIGAKVQLKAVAKFSDGLELDVTDLVRWECSNSLVATVSNALGYEGLLTAHLLGTATVTARLEDHKSSTSVTVL